MSRYKMMNDSPNECIFQLVPIPVISTKCKHDCCTRKFVPLRLAFAISIHQCQGCSIGPTAPGQPNNAAERMILNPGTRSFETLAPGLGYTGMARATTLGGDKIEESALFFCGDDLTTSRLCNMTKYKDSDQLLLKPKKRKAWTTLLDSHTHQFKLNHQELDSIVSWADNTKISYEEFHKALEFHTKNHQEKT